MTEASVGDEEALPGKTQFRGMSPIQLQGRAVLK